MYTIEKTENCPSLTYPQVAALANAKGTYLTPSIFTLDRESGIRIGRGTKLYTLQQAFDKLNATTESNH
jgi:hypothetical protein